MLQWLLLRCTQTNKDEDGGAAKIYSNAILGWFAWISAGAGQESACPKLPRRYEKGSFHQVPSCFAKFAEGIEHEGSERAQDGTHNRKNSAFKEQGEAWEKAQPLTVDEIPAYRRTDILQIRSSEPELKPRVCGNRSDMDQCLIARDMGRFRIHVGLDL